jgi:deazaflavin-dependent oxidoreductase (nitroreductase family)
MYLYGGDLLAHLHDRALAELLVDLASTKAITSSAFRIGGKFLKGTDVVLVTTIGRRSGEPRTVPLLFMEDGADLILVASQGGMPNNPAWYYNVIEHPEVTINRRGVESDMVAREVGADERAVLWPRLVDMYADFTDYQQRTDRTIPVIRLSPR